MVSGRGPDKNAPKGRRNQTGRGVKMLLGVNKGGGGRRVTAAKGAAGRKGITSSIVGRSATVKKKIVRNVKIAKAGVELTKRMTNRKNITKILKDGRAGKGWVLPGSNYIGPGNPMNRKVLSKGDGLAKKHDQAYERYLKAGVTKKRVYGGFSDADKTLMRKSDKTTAEGLATYGGMKAKHLAHKAGLTGPRLREAEVTAKAKVKEKQALSRKSIFGGVVKKKMNGALVKSF